MKHLLRSLLLSLVFAATFITPVAVPATDLSITTTSFVPGANAKKNIGIAGVSITIGQLLYFDSQTQTWKLADANASAATSTVIAISGSAAASGQPVIYITEDDDLTLGATLSMSAPIYVLSANAGGIAPSADIAAGWYPGAVLIAKSTTKCVFRAAAIRSPVVAVAP